MRIIGVSGVLFPFVLWQVVAEHAVGIGSQPQFAVAVFQYIVHKDFVHFGDACEVIRLSVVTHQPRGRAYP